ncbi:MAG: FAD-dependent oxidoreductase [Pyrinomonadaceae bacterium]
MSKKSYDVAVVGAGVFGAWTAHALRGAGLQVLLVDAYGAAHARASSGGESRVIRAGYGADEIYTRWALRTLPLGRELFERAAEPQLFQPTGVLWLAREGDALVAQTFATLQKFHARVERLSRDELARRYAQFDFGATSWAMLEGDGGALVARRAVQTVVREALARGVDYEIASVAAPSGAGRRADSAETSGGGRLSAGQFVFACGAWLPKVFPDVLGGRVRPTRQEVFFFGAPAGDTRFRPPALPTWVDFGAEVYGIPDLEGRGVKLALDRHGAEFDPEAGARVTTVETLAEVRRYLAEHLPALRDAPVVESRVCQYENTSNGDFLIDRHPDFENVLLVGGGSGHGFKHGPALGEYVARLPTEGGATEPRFALATKGGVQHRTIF